MSWAQIVFLVLAFEIVGTASFKWGGLERVSWWVAWADLHISSLVIAGVVGGLVGGAWLFTERVWPWLGAL